MSAVRELTLTEKQARVDAIWREQWPRMTGIQPRRARADVICCVGGCGFVTVHPDTFAGKGQVLSWRADGSPPPRRHGKRRLRPAKVAELRR
jgi:hypothetical protein